MLFIVLTYAPKAYCASPAWSCTHQGTAIIIRYGDIVSQDVDVIVNAANWDLVGFGGVAQHIQDRAGSKLIEHIKKNVPLEAPTPDMRPIRCQTGHAVMTPSFSLGESGIVCIIHTVGPSHDYTPEKQLQLEQCYMSCLDIAITTSKPIKQPIDSIAFPAISTGIYDYPIDKAAQAAAESVITWLNKNPGKLKKIVFVLWSDTNAKQYGRHLMQNFQTLVAD